MAHQVWPLGCCNERVAKAVVSARRRKRRALQGSSAWKPWRSPSARGPKQFRRILLLMQEAPGLLEGCNLFSKGAPRGPRGPPQYHWGRRTRGVGDATRRCTGRTYVSRCSGPLGLESAAEKPSAFPSARIECSASTRGASSRSRLASASQQHAGPHCPVGPPQEAPPRLQPPQAPVRGAQVVTLRPPPPRRKRSTRLHEVCAPTRRP